ncbi:Zn-ribbon domain-containing OB-fold protein [Sphingobium sp. SJ10-10]|uniref:Zn-ribbon domain-containing OB-fold protein n=1 Tax=Sphingobium sp. SJ10-10 TaxID=3114999 RepID=UPI002E187AE8|nr:Zn-ribbon domain-containing OB-fold protein [Sphingobium sp. SJ10-10]
MPETTSPQRPLPLPDLLSEPFWAAARRHELHMQRCDACGRLAYPAEIACRACGGGELHFTPVSGHATLHSWTVLHDPPSPGFRDRLPVILAVVELDEQTRLLMSSNLIGIAPDDLRIGLPLEARFEDVTNDCTLVQFGPARR